MRRLLALALLLAPAVTSAQTPDATPPPTPTTPTEAPAPPPAASPGDSAKASDAFAAGQKSYQSKDYARAAGHFMDAYELDHNPLYLFNAAQAYRLGEECQKAIDAYQAFLEQVQKQNLNVSGTEQVNGYIGGLKTCVENQRKLSAPSNTGAYSLIIGGAAVLAFSLVSQIEANQQHDSALSLVDAAKAGTMVDMNKLNSINSTGRTWADVAVATVIVGGVAAAAGTFLLLHHHKTEQADHAAVVAAPTPGGASVIATWRF